MLRATRNAPVSSPPATTGMSLSFSTAFPHSCPQPAQKDQVPPAVARVKVRGMQGCKDSMPFSRPRALLCRAQQSYSGPPLGRIRHRAPVRHIPSLKFVRSHSPFSSDPAPDAFSIASGSSSPSNVPRSNSHSPKASGMVSPDVEGGRYYAPDSRHHHMGGSHTYAPLSLPLHLSSSPCPPDNHRLSPPLTH